MAYRLMRLQMAVADDASMSQLSFSRDAEMWQVRDLEVAAPTVRVGTADAEAAISLGTLTTAYGIAIFSDYPIKVRLNGASETQFILTSNNTPATNVGAPNPAQCFFACTAQVTSLRIAPIASAARTANVWICASGDPATAYV